MEFAVKAQVWSAITVKLRGTVNAGRTDALQRM